MSEKLKNHVVYTDDKTHHELAMMAARQKVSIKKCLKEIIEREAGKAIPGGIIETVVVSGKSFDVSGEKGQIDWINLDKYPVIKSD